MKLRSSSRSHAQRTSGGISTGVLVRADMFRSPANKTKSSKGANETQRRSKGRMPGGSTEQIELPFKSHVDFDETRNQPQVAEPISGSKPLLVGSDLCKEEPRAGDWRACFPFLVSQPPPR